MSRSVLRMAPADNSAVIDLNAVFNALDIPVIVMDAQGRISGANTSAEQFFGKSLASFIGEQLAQAVPAAHGIETLARRAIEQGIHLTEHGLEIHNPRIGKSAVVDVSISPVPDTGGQVVVHIHERTVVQQVERKLGYLGAARSVSGMAAVLAHEVKNPLSGIRGASQLLEAHVSETDKQLTGLIRDEVDRICALVDRMGEFSTEAPLHPAAINIHMVLDRVQQVAENGFGQHAKFTTDYDPSLPLVAGDRDLLIQVFLNLVKNAAEAVPRKGGEISLTTAYRPGLRLSQSGEQAPRNLPLVVEVTDNGCGIPEDLREHLFDPFVTSKPHGSGLGLALTAKIIGMHGGLIDCDSEPGRSTFRVLLPIHHDNNTHGPHT